MIECPKCGGDGGVDASVFGDHGWHPCFFCGETGFVTAEAMMAYERQEEEALEGFHSGSFPEWEDDDDAGAVDYHNEVTSSWRDSEPDNRWMDEEFPF